MPERKVGKFEMEVETPTIYYSKQWMESADLNTIHCPDGTLLLDCLVSKQASAIIIGCLNNFVLIRDNNDSSPRWIAEMFLREIDKVKPLNIKL